MASHRIGKRRTVIGAVVVVAVLGAGTSAWALTGGGGAAYRTATITRGDVAESLTSTGTISPVRDADLSFQVAGTIAKVLAKEGRKIKAGQRVAILERASLRAALHNARSTLTQTRATLVSDENSQASAASTPSSNTPTPTPSEQPTPTKTPKPSPEPTPSGGTNPVSTTLLAKIRRDQAALIDSVQQADADLATAKSSLAAARTACSATTGSGNNSTNDDQGEVSACIAATEASLADQQTVAADQKAVSTAESTLDADLSSAIASATSPSHAQDTAYTEAASSVVLTAAYDPTGTTVTASTLAADQSKIDAARAMVATARADLSQAVLRSPINGKVAAVTIAKGDAASGTSSDTTPAVKIVGSRQAKVTLNLSAAQVRKIAVEMPAKVTPDGASKPLSGLVAAIGQAVTDGSTGDTTYPVTITLLSHPKNLVSGADAQVSVTLSTRTNVIAVPTSAVHHTSTSTYVETYTAGKLRRTTVKIGAVGPDLTQIVSGLSVGQRVVLANLNAAVPSSSTNLLSNRGGLDGGTTFSQFGAPGSGGGPTFTGPPPSGAFTGGR